MPGADMGLTDKSAIALNIHDLRVVEGERCFLDRRLNLRLGYGRSTKVRQLIERNKEDFETRFGPMHRRGASVQFPQGGSHSVTEYWLTKGQALWVCRKSDARNADDVMEEIIKVFLAVDSGAPLPDTPWTDALLAPDKPTITRGDDNIVRVKHEEPLPSLFDAPLPIDEPQAPNAFKRESWVEEHDNISFAVIQKWDGNGNVSEFTYLRDPPLATSTWWRVPVPWVNGRSIHLCINHIVPFEVIERTYLNQLPDSSPRDMSVKNGVRDLFLKFCAI